jgi:hypothetical protein
MNSKVTIDKLLLRGIGGCENLTQNLENHDLMQQITNTE